MYFMYYYCVYIKYTEYVIDGKRQHHCSSHLVSTSVTFIFMNSEVEHLCYTALYWATGATPPGLYRVLFHTPNEFTV